jgi:hypothetical protein
MKMQTAMLSLLLSASANSLPILTYNNDMSEVTGATGFEVNDLSYSMVLVEDDCEGVNTGCFYSTDAVVGNTTQYHLSSLFRQTFFAPSLATPFPILLESQAVDFDCEDSLFCSTTFIAGELPSIRRIIPANLNRGYFDAIDVLDFGRPVNDSTFLPIAKWMVWSQDPASVYEPGSLVLIALGLAGMALRRKQRAI